MGGHPRPAVPGDEESRLAELRALEILDSAPEPEFDAIVRLAAQICGTPIALVSLVDEHRQWFKARVGLTQSETPRDLSYCAHAILGEGTMEVPDASLDPRFREHPLRLGEPHVEFYAGVPLRTASGQKLGTLCVIDTHPRTLTDEQRRALADLAEQTVALFELRRAARHHQETADSLRAAEDELVHGRSLGAGAPRGALRSLGVVLVSLLLGATIAAHAAVSESMADAEQARLERIRHRIERSIEERGEAYGAILRGTAALFSASENVTRNEFSAYVTSLSLRSNYPGLLGIGVVQQVSERQREEFEELAHEQDPEFDIHPDLFVDPHFVVRFLEPFASNRPAIGFEFASQPERVLVLERARSRGALTLSGRVRLVQLATGGPGFLLVLPLRNSAALVGPGSAGRDAPAWVYGVFSAERFLEAASGAASGEVDFAVQDTPDASPPLHGSFEEIASRAGAVRGRVDLAGSRWELVVAPSDRFADRWDRAAPLTILLLGLCATLLTALLLWSLARTEAHSRSLALRMTGALRRSERTFREVVDGTADFILAIDAVGQLGFSNRALRESLALEPSGVTAVNLSRILHPDERERFASILEAVRRGEDPPALVETAFVTRQGQRIDVEGSLAMVREEDTVEIRCIFRDVTERKRAEAALRMANDQLARLAAHDGLTDLPNRRSFEARFAEEIARARRLGTALSLVLLDVDNFKLYNDTYGHPAGDECLRRVARCVDEACRRAGDLPARYGGEEFVLLLPGTDEAQAAAIAEHLRAAIETMRLPHERNGARVVTASIGVASLGTGERASAEELLQAADRALYRAKDSGRNQVAKASS